MEDAIDLRLGATHLCTCGLLGSGSVKRAHRASMTRHTVTTMTLTFLWGWSLLILGASAQQEGPTNSGSSSSGASGAEVFYTRIDEIAAGVTVGNVIRDADLHMRYDQAVLDSFVMEIIGGKFKDYFRMDTEFVGNLKTSSFLDRDVVCPNKDDCHLALDIAVVRPPQHFQIIKATLTLLDDNDNAPVFSEPQAVIYVSENAFPPVSFVLPTATDPDSGIYGIQTYTFVRRSSKFDLETIDSGDGGRDLRLKLLDRLNREEKASYSLQVQVRDGGLPPKTGLLDIQVVVADANDNTPVFQRSIYNISVPENQPVRSAFLRIQASDPDEGLNGQVRYSLAPQTMDTYGDVFTIGEDSGELSLLQELDYETRTNYHLLVTAQDQGPDSVPVHARVVVNVQDVNDFMPEIAVNAWTSSGRLEVPEDEVASFVAHVSVDDRDLGPSGEVACDLRDRRFQLEHIFGSTYKIMTQAELDREQEEVTELTVHCRDKGVPPLSASVTVSVHVLDVNDHSPEFDQSLYSASVRETASPGTSVLTVTATDRDTGPNAQITYHLHANSNNMLRIDPGSGVITTDTHLDHETLDHLTFHVLARDHGDPTARTATATVSMTIADVNDERPEFKGLPYELVSLENQPAGTEIGSVYAEDRDAAPNDAFTFSLDDNSTFSVDPHYGLIKAHKILDREHQATYHLMVTARDLEPPYLSASASLTIHVADRNDNAPKILYPKTGNDSLEISVFSPEGYIVSRVLATDADFGRNAELHYSFGKGNEEFLFGIDPFNGVVSVDKDLSGAKLSTYDLLVLVRDRGEAEKSATAPLTILVNRTTAFADILNLPKRSGDVADDDGDASGGGLLLGYHEQILIIIGAITFVVVSLLIIAIICIKRRQGAARAERDSYKYMCRVDMAAHAAANPSQTKTAVGVKASPGNKTVVVLSNNHPHGNGADTGGGGGAPPGYDHAEQQCGGGYPPAHMDYSDKPVAMATGIPPDDMTPVSHTCPLHGNRKPSLGTFQRQQQAPRADTGHGDKTPSILSTPEKRVEFAPDSDSTSGCSADMSNSDSGRGPSDEGGEVMTPAQRSHRGGKGHRDDCTTWSPNRHIKSTPTPYVPPRTSSLTKKRSQTGCHGYRNDCHDNNVNVNINSPTQLSKVPSKEVIMKNPGFRNVAPLPQYGADNHRSASTQNLRTFSPPPTLDSPQHHHGYVLENKKVHGSGGAINV